MSLRVNPALRPPPSRVWLRPRYLGCEARSESIRRHLEYGLRRLHPFPGLGRPTWRPLARALPTGFRHSRVSSRLAALYLVDARS